MSTPIAPAMWRPYMALLPKLVTLTLSPAQTYHFDMKRFRIQGANGAYELFRMGMYPDKVAIDDGMDLPIIDGYPNPLTFDYMSYLPLENPSVARYENKRGDYDIGELIDDLHPISIRYVNHQHSGVNSLERYREVGYQRGWVYEWYIKQYPVNGIIIKDTYMLGFSYKAGGILGDDCFLVCMTNGYQKAFTMKVNVVVKMNISQPKATIPNT